MFAVAAMLVGAEAVLAALCFPVGLVLKIDQIVGIVVSDEDHIATAPAVSAVGATPRLIFLAAKAYAAVTAVAGLNFDNAFVDKHRRGISRERVPELQHFTGWQQMTAVRPEN
jgi:hypothetical protein